MAKLHMVTGKGGVGKSSVSAALASGLEKSGHGPVLLLEVQGSGQSLNLMGIEHPCFENTHVPGHSNLWAARILPKDSFRQYFEVLIGLGQSDSTFSIATSALKERLVDLELDNKIVSAFVDVCPGLEPAVLLGKLHWEATKGCTPEEHVPWKHVVVDAPATGHGVMLFKSTFALTEVFSKGVIFKQASDIASFMRSATHMQLYLVSTPEELPLKESLETLQALQKLSLPSPKFIINRYPPGASFVSKDTPSSHKLEAEWLHEVEFEKDTLKEVQELLKTFFAQLPPQSLHHLLTEVTAQKRGDFIANMRQQILEQRVAVL